MIAYQQDKTWSYAQGGERHVVRAPNGQFRGHFSTPLAASRKRLELTYAGRRALEAARRALVWP